MNDCNNACPMQPVERERILQNIETFRRIISNNESRISKTPINLFRNQYKNFQDEDIEFIRKNNGINTPFVGCIDNDVLSSLRRTLAEIQHEISQLNSRADRCCTVDFGEKTHFSELTSLLRMLCDVICECKQDLSSIFGLTQGDKGKVRKLVQDGIDEQANETDAPESKASTIKGGPNLKKGDEMIRKVQVFLHEEKNRCSLIDEQLQAAHSAMGNLAKNLLIDDCSPTVVGKENSSYESSHQHGLQNEIDEYKKEICNLLKEKDRLVKKLSKSKKAVEWNMNERSQAFVQIKKLRKENETLKNKLSSKESDMKGKRTADKLVSTLQSSSNKSLQTEQQVCKIEQLQSKVTVLQKEIEEKNHEIKSLRELSKKEKHDLSKNKYEIQIQVMSAKVEQLTREIRIIEDGKNYEIREIRQIYQERIDQIVAKQQESQIQLQEQVQLYKELEEELQVQRRCSVSHEKAVAQLQTEIEHYASLVMQKEERIKASHQEVETLEKQLYEMRADEHAHLQTMSEEYQCRILELRQNVAMEKIELEKQYCELQEKLSALQIIYRQSEHRLEVTEEELCKYREEVTQLRSQHDVTNNRLMWLTQSIHDTLNTCEQSTSTSDMLFALSWDNFQSPNSDFNENNDEVVLVKRLQSRLKADYESHKERDLIESHMQNEIDQLKFQEKASDVSDDSDDYAINDGVLSQCDHVDTSDNLKLQRSLSKFEMFPKSQSAHNLKPSKSAIKNGSKSHDSALKYPTASSYKSLVISKSSLAVIEEDVKGAEIRTDNCDNGDDPDQQRNNLDHASRNANNPFEKKQFNQSEAAVYHLTTVTSEKPNAGNIVNPFVTEEKETDTRDKLQKRRERRVSFDADALPEQVLIRGRRSSDGSEFDFNHFVNKIEETQSFEACKQTRSLPTTKSVIKVDSNDIAISEPFLKSKMDEQSSNPGASVENLKNMISSFRQSEFVPIIEGSADEDGDEEVRKRNEKSYRRRENEARKQYSTPLRPLPIQSSAEVVLSSNSSVYPSSVYSVEVNPFDSNINTADESYEDKATEPTTEHEGNDADMTCQDSHQKIDQ